MANTLSLAVPQVVMGGLEGTHGTGCLKDTAGKHDPPVDIKLPEQSPCPWGRELGICVGWDESLSKPTKAGSSADHGWKKHLSHMDMTLFADCTPCLSGKGQ